MPGLLKLFLCGCLYVCVCVCMCVCLPLRLLITSGVMWCDMDLIQLVNPLTPKGHYSGFVIKFIIKIITRACLVL